MTLLLGVKLPVPVSPCPLIMFDSLEKVFPDKEPVEQKEKITALWGETASFQVAYNFDSEKYFCGKVVVETQLPNRIRKISHVPATRTYHIGKEHVLYFSHALYKY